MLATIKQEIYFLSVPGGKKGTYIYNQKEIVEISGI